MDWCVRPMVALCQLPALYRITVERGYTSPFGHPRIADLMPEGGTLQQKFDLNKLGTCDSDDASALSSSTSVICLRIARVNHACVGRCNASHFYDDTFNAGAVILLSERVSGSQRRCTCTIHMASQFERRILSTHDHHDPIQ